MSRRPVPPILALLLVATGAVAAGCGQLKPEASRVAKAGIATSELVRKVSPLAYRLCRRRAVHTYYEERLQPAGWALVPDRTWSMWYGSTPWDPQRPQDGTWRQRCLELDRTGDVIDAWAVLLRQYLQAISRLLDRKPFDAGGLEKVGTGAAAVAEALKGGDTLVSTAKGIGGALPALASKIVDLYVQKQLERFVSHAGSDVGQLLARMERYVGGLEVELKANRRHRIDLERAVQRDARPAPAPAGSPTRVPPVLLLELANGLEPSADVERELELTRQRLEALVGLLAALSKAHEGLVREARNRRASADAAIKVLEKRLTDIQDARTEP